MTHPIRRNPNVNKFEFARTGCVLAAQVFAFSVFAESVSKMLLPFQEFYPSIAGARFEDYARKDGVKVTNLEGPWGVLGVVVADCSGDCSTYATNPPLLPARSLARELEPVRRANGSLDGVRSYRS